MWAAAGEGVILAVCVCVWAGKPAGDAAARAMACVRACPRSPSCVWARVHGHSAANGAFRCCSVKEPSSPLPLLLLMTSLGPFGSFRLLPLNRLVGPPLHRSAGARVRAAPPLSRLRLLARVLRTGLTAVAPAPSCLFLSLLLSSLRRVAL
ncbi:uncharacterized protein Tco025E_02262 [Trypanosoma conorhini]|uniref:Secreted protein n=1 Tax=Trypanosoma conorhini TaxID=83891 RepID=A0A422Q5X4_9TRYP|nr:uncharacterized protein Tco025E_02262 [Trypanosoma conorhini]RNF25358.1 hypothetical protein Tco025E_02262 [Trypanosoma conorhini]